MVRHAACTWRVRVQAAIGSSNNPWFLAHSLSEEDVELL
jgi:hypothetical protein